MIVNKRYWMRFLIPLVFLWGCAATYSMQNLRRNLNRYPEYSIVLEDMQEEGIFFKDYFHRYQIIYGEKPTEGDDLVYQTEITDWLQVDEQTYKSNTNNLGMTLASKTRDGTVIDTPSPPGYQYVGDSRYGQWRSNQQGGSFWEFYGKFAFFNSMFNMFSRPVYRSSWNDYRGYRSRREPYYGPRREYGTSGSHTQATKRSFFQRRQARQRASGSGFSNRVQQRVRRSNMSGVRSRSGGSGK